MMTRTCVGCRRSGPKDTLVRIVRTSGGDVALDPGATAPGRGAYVCPREECFERAARAGRLGRALRAGIDEDRFGRLRVAFVRYSEGAQ